MIQQNPQFLEPLLQQLAERDPSIVELIRDNKEEFMEILRQPIDSSVGENDEDSSESPNLVPASTNVPFTQQENDSINRLCAMGFDRHKVIEAYITCDKDEEMAANYLLENMD